MFVKPLMAPEEGPAMRQIHILCAVALLSTGSRGETVDSAEEVDDEIRHLMNCARM